jgi:hypothetical protein
MILVFNLALASHLMALSLAGNSNQNSQSEETVSNTLASTASLHKANSLYENAYHLLVNGHQHSYVNATSAMAILNNLALTYCGVDRPGEADKCWRLLLSVVAHVHYSTSSRMDIDDRDESSPANGFLGNVIHLLLGNNVDSSSSPSPAA